jgi:hypothetical protein
MTSALEIHQPLTCPQCDGTGKVSHIYKYKPQHRSDTNVEDIERREVCPLCNGAGEVTQEALDVWKRQQSKPICPVCKGEGGKYFWFWDEDKTGTRQQFAFEPCSLCNGGKHISSEQLAQYERERRRLRFWGVGCTVMVVVGGLFAVTQVVSLVMYKTPFIQCCAPPHVVFVSGMIVVSHKMGWF